ncbi:MAG: ammonium transporter, Amt family [Frankiales bacterium]|nr:ammonium transporter, Amt family [Frankiales bacterium]
MEVNAGDTAWVLGSTALVLFMTPGLALFYGGMVRSKNVLGIMIQNFACIAVVSIVWALVAYTLAFGPDVGHGFIGDFTFAGLAKGHDPVPGLSLTIPPFAFVAFQMMFAVITTALLTGSGADRLDFRGFLVFATLWVIVVYAPIAHWVFSPTGWLAKRGVLDFAGGTVVEINSGAAGLALALVLRPRRGWPREAMAPHNLPIAVVGAGILWFGWFGFNAGSALGANVVAAHALVTTQLAACAAMLGWLLMERLRTGQATTLGAVSGAVIGLVAITPACGFVPAWAAILIGFVAGAAGVLAVAAKFRLGYDDSLDVLAIHGVGGFIGTLAIGLFAATAVNPAVAHEGLLMGGGAHQLGVQALAVVVTIGWSFTLTYVIATLVQRTVGLRVTPEQEIAGLDQSLHAESAYDLGGVSSVGRMGS